MNSNIDKSFETCLLKDGRALSYSDLGNKNNPTLFYFHGVPGSRLEGLFIATETVKLKYRIISVDRPGMGHSDFQSKRKILQFPDDIIELADYLSIEQFSIIGGSGGGPYAYACAYKLSSERLIKCIVVSGLGPYNLDKSGMNQKSKNSLILAKYFPWMTKTLLWFSISRKVDDEKYWEKNYEKLYENIPEPDRKVVSNKRIKEIMIEKTKDAFRSGTKGPAHDFNLYSKPWGFDLKDIKNKIILYHGELDVNVPIRMAKEISNQLPNCEVNFYKNEGHLSVLINKLEEIL